MFLVSHESVLEFEQTWVFGLVALHPLLDAKGRPCAGENSWFIQLRPETPWRNYWSSPMKMRYVESHGNQLEVLAMATTVAILVLYYIYHHHPLSLIVEMVELFVTQYCWTILSRLDYYSCHSIDTSSLCITTYQHDMFEQYILYCYIYNDIRYHIITFSLPYFTR